MSRNASAPSLKSTRARAHKPTVNAEPTGVPAGGSAPVVEPPVNAEPSVEPPVNVESALVNAEPPVNAEPSVEPSVEPAPIVEPSVEPPVNAEPSVEPPVNAEPSVEPAATLTDDLTAALAKIKDLETTIASMKTAPSVVDTLTALFKGDKAVHAAALTALVRLAHEKDATGASYPHITREMVGQCVTVGVWRGIAIMAKGVYNHESDAFKLGKKIADAAHGAAEKGKEDTAAQKKAANLLNLATILPDLSAGLRLQHAENRKADNAPRPLGIDKVRGSDKAHKRFTAIENAEKAAPVLDKIAQSGALA